MQDQAVVVQQRMLASKRLPELVRRQVNERLVGINGIERALRFECARVQVQQIRRRVLFTVLL